jgi:hypothetical protein
MNRSQWIWLSHLPPASCGFRRPPIAKGYPPAADRFRNLACTIVAPSAIPELGRNTTTDFEAAPVFLKSVQYGTDTHKRNRYISPMSRRLSMLAAYVAQRGLFARVAKQLEFDPSYVSRAANGERHNERITLVIEAELTRMQTANRKIPYSSGKTRSSSVSKKTPSSSI